MLNTIVKRDSRVVEFNQNQITDVINKAFNAVDEPNRQEALKLTIEVLGKIEERYGNGEFNVENVQDLVEEAMIEKGFTKAAKAFILYREKRSRIRDAKSELMDAVAEILKETSRDNANVGNSPSAKVLQISEMASKNYYLKRVIPEHIAKAHDDGDIHIHDISWYGKTLTCLQIPLDRLLRDGFNNGHGYLRSPKSIRSAAALAAIILQSNQNDMHGGQSFAYFDRDMSAYVEMEFSRQERFLRAATEKLGLEADEAKIKELVYERTYEETFQAMEAFIFNLNTMHSRAGAQVPFSSINLGADTSVYGRMITECFLKAYERGLGKGETPLFPNVCFKVKDGVNLEPEDPNYDLFQLSMKVACKRLFPNFSFQDSSFNKPEAWANSEASANDDVAYMGCRTRVIANTNGPAVTNGRGNLSFTTINLPRLGLKANKDISRFWISLNEMLALCVEQLLARYEVQKKLKTRDFPFLMGMKLYQNSEMLELDDVIEPAIKNGTLSIGFIGLAECLVALTGKHHGESPESQALGMAIVSHLRRYCDEMTRIYSLNFSLLATPAEGLSGKFVKIDQKVYGNIKGVTDKEWYTNSFHIPVEYKIDAMDKIALEGVYHKQCNAGHISYIELPAAPNNNLQAFEEVVRAMAEADMGYAAVNFPVDICRDCGFNGLIKDDYCHICQSGNISRVRRITGYLSTLDKFCDSKKAEVEHREVHKTASFTND
jgi:ribonucleoside-triphosphate reductase